MGEVQYCQSYELLYCCTNAGYGVKFVSYSVLEKHVYDLNSNPY